MKQMFFLHLKIILFLKKGEGGLGRPGGPGGQGGPGSPSGPCGQGGSYGLNHQIIEDS